MSYGEVCAAGQVLCRFNGEVGAAGSPHSGEDADGDGIWPAIPCRVKKGQEPDPDLRIGLENVSCGIEGADLRVLVQCDKYEVDDDGYNEGPHYVHHGVRIGHEETILRVHLLRLLSICVYKGRSDVEFGSQGVDYRTESGCESA